MLNRVGSDREKFSTVTEKPERVYVGKKKRIYKEMVTCYSNYVQLLPVMLFLSLYWRLNRYIYLLISDTLADCCIKKIQKLHNWSTKSETSILCKSIRSSCQKVTESKHNSPTRKPCQVSLLFWLEKFFSETTSKNVENVCRLFF